MIFKTELGRVSKKIPVSRSGSGGLGLQLFGPPKMSWWSPRSFISRTRAQSALFAFLCSLFMCLLTTVASLRLQREQLVAPVWILEWCGEHQLAHSWNTCEPFIQEASSCYILATGKVVRDCWQIKGIEAGASFEISHSAQNIWSKKTGRQDMLIEKWFIQSDCCQHLFNILLKVCLHVPL